MKRLMLSLAVALVVCGGDAPAAELSVGDVAPDFTLQGTDGAQHRLHDYKGKQSVVLAWFPKAFTSG
jgi:peroxiredoxin Q/BCP